MSPCEAASPIRLDATVVGCHPSKPPPSGVAAIPIQLVGALGVAVACEGAGAATAATQPAIASVAPLRPGPGTGRCAFSTCMSDDKPIEPEHRTSQ